MIRSMFTAISALNLNQTFLDVISDNLANSNTTGFKASRVIFQDQFAQIMSSGAAPIGNVGGINPTEVGLGVKLGYVSPTFTQGMMQATGRSTDLAVQGNGFFVYTNGQETSYSREGSLEIDADGYLVNNSTGMRITGWMVPAGGSSANIDTNQPTSAMQISLDATVARATTIAALGGNLNSSLTIRAIAAPAILDATSIGSDYAASLSTPTSASSELASGEYTLRTIISGNSTDGYTYAAQILNILGNPVGASINGTYDNAASNTIAFGNGLTVTLDAGLAGDDAVAATIAPTAIGSGMTAVVGVVGSGNVELATGTYSVDYTIAGDAMAGFTYSGQLLDDAGDPVGLPVTGTYDPASGSTMNFLNGLTVDLDPGLPNGSVTGTDFVYTHSIPAEGPQTITSGSIEYTHSVTATDGASVETTIAVYDSLGDAHTPTFQFTRTTDPLIWNWRITSPLTANGSGTLTFTSDGLFSSATGTDSITIPGSVGADPIVLTNFDLSSLTMFSSDTTLSPRSQDGLAAGSVSELYGAPNTGEMYLVYSNGLKQLVGQLALAHFTNPSGLLRAGSNQYKIGLNSGEPQIGTANTGGRGAITSGYLEASNVDMAQEFTNMILAQRSFQASTRVITTSDEILQELVNLKR